MRIDLLDFPQPRVAPIEVTRALEALDPTACLVHLGGPDWLVGKVRPNAAARREAEGIVAHWTAAIRQAVAMGRPDVARTLTQQAVPRLRFASLALLGVRVVGLYQVTTDAQFADIVHDFRRSRWEWLHAAEDAPLTWQDAADARRQAANTADLTDPGRARDAWRYAFTRSHAPGIPLTPIDRPRSGFVRHPLRKVS